MGPDYKGPKRLPEPLSHGAPRACDSIKRLGLGLEIPEALERFWVLGVVMRNEACETEPAKRDHMPRTCQGATRPQDHSNL